MRSKVREISVPETRVKKAALKALGERNVAQEGVGFIAGFEDGVEEGIRMSKELGPDDYYVPKAVKHEIRIERTIMVISASMLLCSGLVMGLYSSEIVIGVSTVIWTFILYSSRGRYVSLVRENLKQKEW